MEDTRRKPSDDVFNDIRRAAELVWLNGNYHPDYEAEKLEEVRRITNYADNWSSIVGMLDGNNQLLMCCHLKRQESIDFLKSMRAWYSISLPIEKASHDK